MLIYYTLQSLSAVSASVGLVPLPPWAKYPWWISGMLIIATELCSRRRWKLNWGLTLMLLSFFVERCYTRPCHCRSRTSFWGHKASLGRYSVRVDSSSDAELLATFHDDVCYDAESSSTHVLSQHQIQCFRWPSHRNSRLHTCLVKDMCATSADGYSTPFRIQAENSHIDSTEEPQQTE